MSVLKPRLTTTASPDVVAPAHPCARDTDTSLCGVRRAFLCGEDRFSGVNYDHRKEWVVDRMKFLSSVFAIDICAYAVMSNHYHLALHVDETKSKSWTDGEVATSPNFAACFVIAPNSMGRQIFSRKYCT